MGYSRVVCSTSCLQPTPHGTQPLGPGSAGGWLGGEGVCLSAAPASDSRDQAFLNTLKPQIPSISVPAGTPWGGRPDSALCLEMEPATGTGWSPEALGGLPAGQYPSQCRLRGSDGSCFPWLALLTERGQAWAEGPREAMSSEPAAGEAPQGHGSPGALAARRSLHQPPCAGRGANTFLLLSRCPCPLGLCLLRGDTGGFSKGPRTMPVTSLCSRVS